MKYSLYYQAYVSIPDTWFVTATLRSFEHLVFDRTIDKQQGLFEFFVPADMEPYFLQVMTHFQQQGIVNNLQAMDNRLKQSGAQV